MVLQIIAGAVISAGLMCDAVQLFDVAGAAVFGTGGILIHAGSQIGSGSFLILDANCTAKIIKLIGLDNIVAGIDSIINTAGSYNGIVIIAPVEQNRLACFAIGAFFYDFADSFSFGLGGIGEFQTGSVACNDLFQCPVGIVFKLAFGAVGIGDFCQTSSTPGVIDRIRVCGDSACRVFQGSQIMVGTVFCVTVIT